MINKEFNIFMNDCQKYIILGYYNKIREYEIENHIKKLNIKYIIKRIYIEILGYDKCVDIKIHNNMRKINEYYPKWLNITNHIKLDMTNDI